MEVSHSAPCPISLSQQEIGDCPQSHCYEAGAISHVVYSPPQGGQATRNEASIQKKASYHVCISSLLPLCLVSGGLYPL